MTDHAPAARHRPALALVALLSIGIVLYAVPAYLVPGHVHARVGIRADVPYHLPFLVVHAATGGIALLVGPLQFVRRLRRAHRLIGRLYLFGGVFPASLSGVVVALLTTAGWAARVSFTLLDLVWAATAVLGYRAVRARRYRDHERWMRRNFALTFAGVTLRLWLGLLIAVQLPFRDGDFRPLFDTAYTAAALLSWLPNLLYAEFRFLRPRARQDVEEASAGFDLGVKAGTRGS
ncbi:DUF2306 domain-containing protein [Actinomadura macrotermitis]|uniref:DUF2306 domain-containing protein n=1 Tax=Actinomadura macrotermitis TaxID=2585200 RepID=A0A7K0BW78_9ACTN|nr:DUF2306 domain-containing protein [Actinomadura macrotermitis]MQY05421.1 hypothetical protein [Actinomadura macrotermitis]